MSVSVVRSYDELVGFTGNNVKPNLIANDLCIISDHVDQWHQIIGDLETER